MIYRKQGSVARWENGTLIRVTECGVAIEDGEYFQCRPDVGRGFSPPAVGGGLKPALRSFERLILTDGYAEHEYGENRWTEYTQRLHASITHGRLRALVDQSTFDMTLVEHIANALQRAEAEERELAHGRLEPNVTAALLPHMVGRTPSNVRLLQTAGGVDGYGNPIVEVPVEANVDWPNAYRPSYRVRPVRMPHNLRLECANTNVDEAAPRAIALLAPVTDLTIRVLVVDGQRVYPATVTLTKIRAVSDQRSWYPYAAGSFGAAMML